MEVSQRTVGKHGSILISLFFRGLLTLVCIARLSSNVLAEPAEKTASKSSKSIQYGSSVEDVNRVLNLKGQKDKEFNLRTFQWPPTNSRQLLPAYVIVKDDDQVISARYPIEVSKIEPRTLSRWREVMGSPGQQVRTFRRAGYKWSFKDGSVFWGSFDDGKLSEKYAP